MMMLINNNEPDDVNNGYAGYDSMVYECENGKYNLNLRPTWDILANIYSIINFAQAQRCDKIRH